MAIRNTIVLPYRRAMANLTSILIRDVIILLNGRVIVSNTSFTCNCNR